MGGREGERERGREGGREGERETGGGDEQVDEMGEALLVPVVYVFSFRIIVEFILLQAHTHTH